MNIKKFLLIKACKTLPSELIENIWSFVKTDAKKLIQEFIQKMYYRKIERVRRMFLVMDVFSNNNIPSKLELVFYRLLNYDRIANYMYIQDTERFIRYLYGIKWRYYDRHLSYLVDKIVSDITKKQLEGKARMARLLALRTIDYKISTTKYIEMTFSPVIFRLLFIMNNSLSDVKIDLLDYILKYYHDNIQKDINIRYDNPLGSYLIANPPLNTYDNEVE